MIWLKQLDQATTSADSPLNDDPYQQLLNPLATARTAQLTYARHLDQQGNAASEEWTDQSHSTEQASPGARVDEEWSDRSYTEEQASPAATHHSPAASRHVGNMRAKMLQLEHLRMIRRQWLPLGGGSCASEVRVTSTACICARDRIKALSGGEMSTFEAELAGELIELINLGNWKTTLLRVLLSADCPFVRAAALGAVWALPVDTSGDYPGRREGISSLVQDLTEQGTDEARQSASIMLVLVGGTKMKLQGLEAIASLYSDPAIRSGLEMPPSPHPLPTYKTWSLKPRIPSPERFNPASDYSDLFGEQL